MSCTHLQQTGISDGLYQISENTYVCYSLNPSYNTRLLFPTLPNVPSLDFI